MSFSSKRKGRIRYSALLHSLSHPKLKKIYYSLASVLVIGIFLFLGLRFFENKAFQSRVNMKELRAFVTYAIQEDLKKAVDLGIIGFSIWDGVIIEDLVIGQEEDFSNNKRLMHSKKVLLKLSSIFSPNPYIKKIEFIKPKISIDIDDPFFSKFVGYLQKINIQEVEFIDAEIEIRRGKKIILNWTQASRWTFKQNNRNIDFHFDNGFYFVPFLGRIHGDGNIVLKEDLLPEIKLKSEWKNTKVEEFPGLIEWISGLRPLKGKMNGNLVLFSEENHWHIQNSTQYNNLSGSFFIQETDLFENMELLVEMDAKIEKKEDNSQIHQSYFHESGQWMWEWEEKKSLRSGTSQWDMKDLSKFIKFFPNRSDIILEGSLIGNLKWEETGVRTKWFNLDLENRWMNGKWEQEGWKLGVDQFYTKIEKNRWMNDWKGSIFGSEFSLDSSLQLQFWRSIKPDGSVYYPMGTTGSISGNIDEIRIIDWSHYFFKIKNTIEKDIQERKEKLILKNYFTEFKIYRYLLEDMNIDWKITVGNIIASKDGQRLKDWNFNGYIKNGATKVDLVQNQSVNRMEFSTRFATKLPYLDFRLKLKDVPWKRYFGKLCGMDFTMDSLSQDIRFRGMGADFYNISKSASITGELEWKGVEFQEPEENLKRKIPIPEMNWKNKFNLAWDLSHYGEISYYRNIELTFDENHYLKGSGGNKADTNLFTLYGKSGDMILKYNLEEQEKYCK